MLFRSMVEKQKLKANLLSTCSISAASMSAELVEDIGSIEDINNPRYMLLKKRLVEMQKTCPEYRWIYLMVVRGGKIIFSADSEPVTSKDYSRPGDVYEDPPDELRALFRGKHKNTMAEYEDRWGNWISAFVPVLNNTSTKMIAVLGIDISQKNYRADINHERLGPIVITLLVLVLLIAFYIAYERQSDSIEHVIASENALRDSEQSYHNQFASDVAD